MQIKEQASIRIVDNGRDVSVTTALSLDDLQKNGLAWCEPVKALAAQPDAFVRLGTYLNIAAICRQSALPVEEIGILRRVAREFGRQCADVTPRIQALLPHDEIAPDLPAGWSIVAVDRDEQRFKSLAAIEGNVYANFWHPGAKLGGLPGTLGLDALPGNAALDNVSFHVCLNNVVVATVPAVVDATHTLAWVTNHPSSGPMPIEVHFAQPDQDRTEACKVIVAYLRHLAKRYGASQFSIMERPDEQFTLYRAIIKKARAYSAELWDRPVVDLRASHERIYAGIRKSYKSNINWCAKNLTVDYLSGDAITNEMTMYIYSVIQDLHKELIEKYSDGMTTDLFMHPLLMCRIGNGEVAITRTADGVPWGITVTTWDGGVGYYALGGSRTLQGKNVGHFIVHDAIQRAKARGLQTYVMNRFFPATVSLNQTQPKLQCDRAFNIAFFKRGYSDDTEIVNVYHVLS